MRLRNLNAATDPFSPSSSLSRQIDSIVLMRDPDTGQSKGYGFITFAEAECARRALEQLNGFELAGRPMRVGQVTERLDGTTDITFPEGNEEAELAGATGRLQLMAKLAEGLGGWGGDDDGEDLAVGPGAVGLVVTLGDLCGLGGGWLEEVGGGGLGVSMGLGGLLGSICGAGWGSMG
uniref:RRM domain-containing protein n=1 Tax=Apteryx owenii TaxID=8824 RepID=A0A8B9SBN3_APTOW